MLIINLSGSTASAMLHSTMGGLKPIKFQPHSSPTTRLQIGLLKSKGENGVFIFGNQVENYISRAKEDPQFSDNFLHWNINHLLGSPNNHWEYHPQNSPTPTKLTVDMLLGLYFQNLKGYIDSETKLPVPITQLVFSVSPWLSSLERSRLKLSAELAGFQESLIINHPTLLTLLHFNSSSALLGSTHHFLVLYENQGYLNLIRYTGTQLSCYTELKMLECTDDLQTTCYNPETRVSHLTTLLKKLKASLPSGVEPLPKHGQLLLFCQNFLWKPALEQVVKNHPVKLYHNHLEAFVPIKFPVVTNFSVLSRTKLIDLTLDVYFSDQSSPSNQFTSLTEISDLQESSGLLLKTTISHPTEVAEIFQMNGINEQRYAVGSFQFIEPIPPEINLEAHFRLDKEGIVQFTLMTYCGLVGLMNDLGGIVNYKWTPYVNPDAAEKEELREEIKRVERGSKEHKKEMERYLDKVKVLCVQLWHIIVDDKVFQEYLIKKEIVWDLGWWVMKLLERVEGIKTPLVDFHVEQLVEWIETLKTLMRIRMGVETDDVDRKLEDIMAAIQNEG